MFGSVPLKEANNFKCSSGVSISKRTSCYGQTPNIILTSCIYSKMSMPKTSAFPFVGSISPVNIEIAVVLPAPLCPRRAKIWPEYIVKSIPFTATFYPKVFPNPLILRHSLSYSYLFRNSGMASKFLGSLFLTFSPSISLSWVYDLLLLIQRKFHGLATPKSLGTT